jgi:hypothetical protein
MVAGFSPTGSELADFRGSARRIEGAGQGAPLSIRHSAAPESRAFVSKIARAAPPPRAHCGVR